MLIYLAFWDSRVYNVVKANKGRAKGATNTLRPYAGACTSHTIALSYANPYYNGSLENWQVGNQ